MWKTQSADVHLSARILLESIHSQQLSAHLIGAEQRLDPAIIRKDCSLTLIRNVKMKTFLILRRLIHYCTVYE